MSDRLFDEGTVSARQFAPPRFVQAGARQFAQQQGLDWHEPDPQLQNDHVRGFVQQQAYRSAMANPTDRPGIAKSYAAATEHINAQYDHMTRPGPIGMGIKHEVTTDDPYPSPAAMAADLEQNRRVRTFATASTNAGANQAPTLQAFDNDTNDKFRAVHEVFGHAATGRGFTRHGEEAAFQSHVQMFPPRARAAVASETRGQNSFLNYGKESEFPEVGRRMVGMPSWAAKTGPLPDRVLNPQQTKRSNPGTQGRLF